jgi:hypothetical protein
MKFTRLLLAFLFILSMAVSTNAADKGYKKILGVWEFSAPTAPSPYDSGLLTLKEVDQKLVAEFTIQGQAMTIPQTAFDKDALTLGFEVENTPITLILNFKDGKLEGKTDTPNGPVAVTAKPQKK